MVPLNCDKIINARFQEEKVFCSRIRIVNRLRINCQCWAPRLSTLYLHVTGLGEGGWWLEVDQCSFGYEIVNCSHSMTV